MGEAFSFNYDLPNDTAYAETCASIGLIFWARRMLELCPDSRYSDVMEQALYNTVLSGMALDGKSFFYVNPLEVYPEACQKDERKFHVKPVRQKWFGCACCPPNLARIISSVSSYAFTAMEDTLFVHLYIGSTIHRTIGGQDVTIQLSSGFPWSGDVSISVSRTEAPFTLALRVPGWSSSHTIWLEDGSGTSTMIPEDAVSLRDGYLYVTRLWNGSETLRLDFPMEVRLWQADPRIREDIGRAAVTRGPIVYCLEEADNGADLHLLTLCPDGEPQVEDASVCSEPVKAILLPGFREALPEHSERRGLYHPVSPSQKQAVTLRFIPYYTWANRGENEMCVWVRL